MHQGVAGEGKSVPDVQAGDYPRSEPGEPAPNRSRDLLSGGELEGG